MFGLFVISLIIQLVECGVVGTGNTVVKAVEVLKANGVDEENIIVLNLFSTPNGKKSYIHQKLKCNWCWFTCGNDNSLCRYRSNL